MGRAPDKFFKKKHVYVLLAHGSEIPNTPRTVLQPPKSGNHNYVALTKYCGTNLLIYKDNERQLFEYKKQALIPTSHAEFGRAEASLDLTGTVKNSITGVVTKAEFKLYSSRTTPKFDIRYNAVPNLQITPIVYYTHPYNNEIRYFLNPHDRTQLYVSSNNTLLKFLSSGLFSKTNVPQLPPECETASEKLNLSTSPSYGPNYVASLVPTDIYKSPLYTFITMPPIYNSLLALIRMMKGSYFSFLDFCICAMIHHNLSLPVSGETFYQTFQRVKLRSQDQIHSDLRTINEFMNMQQQHRSITPLSPLWTLSLQELLATEVPFEFFLTHLRTTVEPSENILLISPVCREVNTSQNQLENTITRHRKFSHRTPESSARRTHRKRYKWRNKTAKSSPKSTPPSPKSNSGYNNYGNLPSSLP